MVNDNAIKISSIETTFSIIEVLLERGGARPSEVADETDRALSTVHDHLSTLRGLGYVTKDGDIYRASLRFLGVAESITSNAPKFDIVREEAEEITRETGMDVDFMVEENGRGVYLIAGTKQVDYSSEPNPGDREFLHSTAAGKAILAEMPPKKVDSVVDRWGLPSETGETITDRETLQRNLETIEERGYAMNDQENKVGLRAVATTVTNLDGTVFGGLSLTGPTYQIDDEIFHIRMPELAQSAVRDIESKLETVSHSSDHAGRGVPTGTTVDSTE